MRQRGMIIKKEEGHLQVQIQDPKRTCGSCNGCLRLTPERPPEDYVVFVKDDSAKYTVGDEVLVEGQMNHFFKAIAVLYGVPFFSLFAGYGLTRVFSGSDPLSGIGAVVGLLVGAIVARPIARHLSKAEPEFKITARACS